MPDATPAWTRTSSSSDDIPATVNSVSPSASEPADKYQDQVTAWRKLSRAQLRMIAGKMCVCDSNGEPVQWVTNPNNAQALLRDWNERLGRGT